MKNKFTLLFESLMSEIPNRLLEDQEYVINQFPTLIKQEDFEFLNIFFEIFPDMTYIMLDMSPSNRI
jgi:hypothetical protein